MITQQQIANKKIKENGTATDSDIIKELIEEHNVTSMIEGQEYYENEPKIRDRQRYYWDRGNRKVDPTKPNNKMAHNWHKLLVDQKVGYLLGKPISVNAEPDSYAEKINDMLTDDFHDELQETGKEAANKGVAYWHPYIDKNGEFSYVLIPSEQLILIYDNHLQQNKTDAIRYYNITFNGEKRIKAEWWTPKQVTYYMEDANGDFVLDPTEDENPASHFYYRDKGYGWERVPFIVFKNNEEQNSDLTFYKELIDVYDKVNSDVANDLEEIQQAVTVLKGYEGTDLSEFMRNLRYYKVIKTSEDGDVDSLENEIPINSIDSFLDRLEENIITFGQGVNPKTDKFGQSPSGIALKFLYHLLDLKANITARKFRKSLQEFFWFVTEFYDIKGEKQNDWEVSNIEVTFNKSMLINDKEMSEIAQQSKGIIPDENILAHHPWIEDPQKAKEKMEEERSAYLGDE